MAKRWNDCDTLEREGGRIIQEIEKVFGGYFGDLKVVEVGVLEGLGGEVLNKMKRGREVGEDALEGLGIRMRMRIKEMENDIRAKVGAVIYLIFKTK